jgi:hypothetical protein
LINVTSEVGIQTGKLSTLFDHKAVFLRLGRINVVRDYNRIQDSFLEIKTIRLMVELSVKEFYLNNADRMATPRYEINVLRFKVGRILNKLTSATDTE